MPAFSATERRCSSTPTRSSRLPRRGQRRAGGRRPWCRRTAGGATRASAALDDRDPSVSTRRCVAANLGGRRSCCIVPQIRQRLAYSSPSRGVKRTSWRSWASGKARSHDSKYARIANRPRSTVSGAPGSSMTVSSVKTSAMRWASCWFQASSNAPATARRTASSGRSDGVHARHHASNPCHRQRGRDPAPVLVRSARGHARRPAVRPGLDSPAHIARRRRVVRYRVRCASRPGAVRLWVAWA